MPIVAPSKSILNFKQKFDRALARYLDRKLKTYAEVTDDRFIREVIAYTRELAMSGGKRVRPYMAYITYKAAGGRNDAKAIELFVALELFHLFALVHDDIMDRGQERHGIPTTHAHVSNQLRKLKRRGDLARLGEAQAILIGDLLFAWANELIAASPCRAVFSKMVNEVMVGQMIDVDVMTRDRVETTLIDEKMRLKTAGYTFVRPMQMGAALAGVNGKTAQFCEAYGWPLGVAFQIQDDFLDLTAPASVLGKTAFSDLQDRQHTLFTQHIFSRGTKKQVQELRQLLGRPLGEKDRKRIQKLFVESGAFSEGTRLMHEAFDQAEEAVVNAGLSSAKAKPFLELVSYIRSRSM